MNSVLHNYCALDQLTLKSPLLKENSLDEVITRFKNIGDDGISLVEECVILTDMITSIYHKDESYIEAIMMITKAMIIEQPHKQPNIAFLYIQISKMDSDITIKIISSVIQELQEQLDLTATNDSNILHTNVAGPWTTIKLLTRFISLLSPIIGNKYLIAHYRNIIELACGMNQRRIILANLVLESALINIPYLFYYNRQSKVLLFEILTLINVAESTFKGNSQIVNLFQPFCFDNEDNSYTLEENISLKKIKLLLNNGLDKFNKIFPNLARNVYSVRCDVIRMHWSLRYPKLKELRETQYVKSGYSVTDNIWEESTYLTYESKFDRNKYLLEEQSLIEYDQHIIRDNVIDIVHNLNFNKKEASKKLIQLENYLGNAPTKSDEEYLKTDINRRIVTTITSLMLRLQYTNIPTVYYSTLLQELCKRKATMFGPLLGEQFRFIYENLCSLDYEGTLNFEKWFRLQITNFDFRWKWYEWENDCTCFFDMTYNAKHIFHQNVVKRLLNSTSNISDFKTNLPKPFEKLLNNKYFSEQQLTKNMRIQFKLEYADVDFNNAGLVYLQSCFDFSPIVANIIDFMKQNKSDRINNCNLETMNIFLEQIETDNFAIFNNFSYFALELLTQCICHCRRRSMSHANIYISLFGNVLLQLSEKYKIERELAQKIVLESVSIYWNQNISTSFLIINSFKQFDLVDNLVILEFLFHGCDHEIKVITCYDARQFLLNTLEDEMRWSPEINVFLFVRAYRLTLMVTSGALNDLDIGNNEDLEIPECKRYSCGTSRENNTRWQYFESMKLVKCLLRKFHSVYRSLADILINILKQVGITHRNTIHAIVSWVKECQNID
ncbi:hypothetical protein C6P45_004668 [Maudiozyma exigua]|uniref:MIF4G domain-containing protein n=1 Tax=Maudiozyma exigua TaxID=34358 RepID=A0A9P7B9Q3_MAUEX|nr:hypothetical protein C6P45_004668 [Kazachstania exigua]